MDEQRFRETIAQIKQGDLASALRTIHECLDGNPDDRVAALCALGYVFERKREEQSAVYLYFQTLQLARDHKDARYRLRRLQQKFPDLQFDHHAIANSYVHECPSCRLNSQQVYSVCPYCGGTVAEHSESTVELPESGAPSTASRQKAGGERLIGALLDATRKTATKAREVGELGIENTRRAARNDAARNASDYSRKFVAARNAYFWGRIVPLAEKFLSDFRKIVAEKLPRAAPGDRRLLVAKWLSPLVNVIVFSSAFGSMLFRGKRRVAVTAAFVLFVLYLAGRSDDSMPVDITDRSARSIVADAKDGSPEAQAELGRRYYEGDGFDQDYKLAHDLFLRASEQNFPPAFAYLGDIAYDYKSQIEDRDKALEWWKRGVKLGDSECAYKLGTYFMTLRSGMRSVSAAKGVELLRKSAEQGNQSAQFHMGKIYFTGIDTTPHVSMFQPRSKNERNEPLFKIVRDSEAGAAYIEPLALEGDSEAIQFLSEQLFRRRYGSKWATTALDLFEREAERGNEYAQVAMTYIYFRGDFVDEDAKVGYKWLQKAVSQDNAMALNTMGLLYMTGTHLEKDFKVAEEWFVKAMEQGSTEAEVNIGIMHLNGWGRPADERAAQRMFNSAASKGNKRGDWLSANIRTKAAVEWREFFKGLAWDSL